MAAAALLRSMARKLARAAPLHPRPLLAEGLARSGPGASLPPLTSNQIRQVSGDPLVGLRSGAALPSLSTKIARASPQPRHPRILNRRLHSGGTPPPTTDNKDKIIEDLRHELRFARALTGMGGIVLLGLLGCSHFWLLPRVKKMRDRCVACERLLRDIVIRADEDERRQIIQTAGHMKQQSNGTTEKGTRVDKLEGDVMALSFDILKEAAAGTRVDKLEGDVMALSFDILKEAAAGLKEMRAATARMSKSAPLEQKEGCSRVGSEAVSS